jgi:hypothetical protein
MKEHSSLGELFRLQTTIEELLRTATLDGGCIRIKEATGMLSIEHSEAGLSRAEIAEQIMAAAKAAGIAIEID